MAKKKVEKVSEAHEQAVRELDPIQAQIELLTYISKDDMVATANLVNKMNQYYQIPGEIAIKETLMPNQYSTVNACSIYAAQHLKCLKDQQEVLFYQRYYYALANHDDKVYYEAMNELLYYPAKTFSEQLYLDAVKLALTFRDLDRVNKIKTKI